MKKILIESLIVNNFKNIFKFLKFQIKFLSPKDSASKQNPEISFAKVKP